MRTGRAGRTLARVAAAAALVLGSARAGAYDGDTHYAWTYYLALHVGYTPRQAYQIASATWAVDHDSQTGPMHATMEDAVSGAPNPVIERVWRRFHSFADAVYVGRRPDADEVARGRRESEETLAAIGARQGNPGAQLHNLQDFFAHNEYDSVRGHAVWGHAPDRIGHRPNRARAMTRRTIAALAEFAPSVGVTPRDPDEARLFEVLERLSQANPPLLQLEPANYDVVWDAIVGVDLGVLTPSKYAADEVLERALGKARVPSSLKSQLGIDKIAWGDVSLSAAVAVVNQAVAEDQDGGRLRRFPADWRLPEAWIQYDFDADGAAVPSTLARNHFAVERVKVAFGEASVAFRRDASTASLYEVTVEQKYAVEGMATLPAFRALPVQERSAWSDDAEQIRLDRDRTNGTFTIQRKVFRPLAALQAGAITWTPSVVLFGDEEAKAPPVVIRFDGDYEWFLVTLEGTGVDVKLAGVATGAPGENERPGLRRRRGRADVAVVRLERGAAPAAALAEIRRAVAEPRCRRPAALPPGGAVEAPGADLTGLPDFWDEVRVDLRGPFPTAASARGALRPAVWTPLGFEPRTDFAELEFRSGCRVGAAPPAAALVAVPEVSGSTAEEAAARLQALGLRPEPVAGAAARSRAEQYTVERQEPAAGQRVAPGSVVRIAVRPAWVEPARSVPGVVGLPAAAADAALRAAGFGVTVTGGDPAPSAERAFTVQDQQPPAGSAALPGSAVTVRVHSREAARRTVPLLVGLPAAAADRRLRELGLVAEIVGGDPAPAADLAFTIQFQQPAAGAAVDAGAPVRLHVHSAFAAPRVVPTPGTAVSEPVIPPGSGDPGFFTCPPYRSRAARRERLSPGQTRVGCYGYPGLGESTYVLAQWAATGSSWKVPCGAPPQTRFFGESTQKRGIVDLATGSTNYYDQKVPAAMSAAFYGSKRQAMVTFTWFSDREVPLPPELKELGERALAEAEWRGLPCGVDPGPAAAPTPGPPPPRATARPAPPVPADTRLPCTCRDAAGKPYRMTVSGGECDPGSWLRSDDCKP